MEKLSQPKKSGPLEVVESNGIKIPIYRANAFGKTGYMIAYYADGKRIRERAATIEDARKTARAKIKTLTSGTAHVGTLTPRQTAVVSDAVEILRGVGVPLSDAARQFAEAFKILDGKGTIVEAARFFVTERAVELADIKFSDAAKKFEIRNADQNFSASYKADCRQHLAILSKSLGSVSIRDLKKPELTAALKAASRGRSVRRFKNLRGTLNAFFSYAQGEGWLRQDRQHEADAVEIPNETNPAAGMIQIYTPEEITTVLSRIDSDMVPFVVLSGFAGLRSSEVHRMAWEMIRFPAKVIVLDKAFTKTKRRRVIPLCDSVIAWLEPLAKKGLIYDCTLDHLEYRLKKAWPTDADGKQLVPRRKNALRHSYGTYRFALLQDEQKVSSEMGNSPTELREHYAEIALPDDAKKWFSIMPSDPKKAKK